MSDAPRTDACEEFYLRQTGEAINQDAVWELSRQLERELATAQVALARETAIVDKIWDQFGRPTYRELNGRSIHDLIDSLKAEIKKMTERLVVYESAVLPEDMNPKFTKLLRSFLCGLSITIGRWEKYLHDTLGHQRDDRPERVPTQWLRSIETFLDYVETHEKYIDALRTFAAAQKVRADEEERKLSIHEGISDLKVTGGTPINVLQAAVSEPRQFNADAALKPAGEKDVMASSPESR